MKQRNPYCETSSAGTTPVPNESAGTQRRYTDVGGPVECVVILHVARFYGSLVVSHGYMMLRVVARFLLWLGLWLVSFTVVMLRVAIRLSG